MNVRWLRAARPYGIAAAFLVAAMLVSALVGAADLNPLATVSATVVWPMAADGTA